MPILFPQTIWVGIKNSKISDDNISKSFSGSFSSRSTRKGKYFMISQTLSKRQTTYIYGACFSVWSFGPIGKSHIRSIHPSQQGGYTGPYHAPSHHYTFDPAHPWSIASHPPDSHHAIQIQGLSHIEPRLTDCSFESRLGCR